MLIKVQSSCIVCSLISGFICEGFILKELWSVNETFQTIRLYTCLCNGQMWSTASLCWFSTYFIPWWPNLWQKEEHFAEEWNHKVGVNTDDIGSYSVTISSIQCNNIQIRNPRTQAKHCWINKSAHMFGVFKDIQMNLPCENCKNYYSQYSDSIYPIENDWKPNVQCIASTNFTNSVLRWVVCWLKLSRHVRFYGIKYRP